jgi:hypothetical protein
MKVSHVIDATCLVYDVRRDELVGPCRKRQYAWPRQVAMYLARELTSASYPALGRMYGGRDHSTVLFAHRKIKRLLSDGRNVAGLGRVINLLSEEHDLHAARRERDAAAYAALEACAEAGRRQAEEDARLAAEEASQRLIAKSRAKAMRDAGFIAAEASA